MNRGSMNQSMGMGMNQSTMGNRTPNSQPNSAMNQSMGMGNNSMGMGNQSMGMGNSGMNQGRQMAPGGGMRPPMPGTFNNTTMMGNNMGGMNTTQGFQGGNASMQQGGGWNNGYNNGYGNNGYGHNEMGMMSNCNCCQPPMPGVQVDEYICATGPEQPNTLNPLAQMCDCATTLTFLSAILSIVGFAVVMATTSTDNIFKVYDNVENTIQLQESMMANIPYLMELRNLSDTRTDNLTRTEIINVTTIATTTPTTTTMVTTTTTPTTTTAPTSTSRINASNTSTTTTVTPVARAFNAMAGEVIGWDTTTNHKNVAPDPVWTQACGSTKDLTGTWGSVCVEQSLNGATFYFHLHRWTVFRNTLYFIAMVGTVVVAALVFVIHRVKNPPFGGPQQVNQSQYQGDVPITFAGTNFYLVFRAGWMMVSFVIFLWVATVMYEYWFMISSYKDMTNGDLRAFFVDYDKKFVASVVCITIYLCWPLMHTALEIGLFAAFIIPWYAFRTMCKPGLENVRYPVETPLDDIPGWVRIDMFFTDFMELKRLGFSVQLWHLLTGTYTEYFEFCNQPNFQQMQMQQGGPQAGGMGGMGGNTPQQMNLSAMHTRRGSNAFPPMAGTPTANGSNGMLMAGQMGEDFTLSPTKRDKSDKSEHRDKKSKSKDRSKSKERKSKERSHHRRHSEASAEIDVFSRSVQGETNERTEKKEKRDKTDKQDKHHRSSSKRDKSDKKDKSERSKSKKDKKDKDSAVLQIDD